jgi:hypothetical protein
LTKEEERSELIESDAKVTDGRGKSKKLEESEEGGKGLKTVEGIPRRRMKSVAYRRQAPVTGI